MQEPQQGALDRASTLSAALVALSRARREGQILGAATLAARQLAGAQSVLLLSRDPDRPAAHPLFVM